MHVSVAAVLEWNRGVSGSGVTVTDQVSDPVSVVVRKKLNK